MKEEVDFGSDARCVLLLFVLILASYSPNTLAGHLNCIGMSGKAEGDYIYKRRTQSTLPLSHLRHYISAILFKLYAVLTTLIFSLAATATVVHSDPLQGLRGSVNDVVNMSKN